RGSSRSARLRPTSGSQKPGRTIRRRRILARWTSSWLRTRSRCGPAELLGCVARRVALEESLLGLVRRHLVVQPRLTLRELEQRIRRSAPFGPAVGDGLVLLGGAAVVVLREVTLRARERCCLGVRVVGVARQERAQRVDGLVVLLGPIELER